MTIKGKLKILEEYNALSVKTVMPYIGNLLKYKKIVDNLPNKKEIISILSNPKHWCPSKKEQWRRVSNAIINRIQKK